LQTILIIKFKLGLKILLIDYKKCLLIDCYMHECICSPFCVDMLCCIG